MPTNKFFDKSSFGGVKVIDVSKKPVQAEILRDGVKVPSVFLDYDKVKDFINPELLDDIRAQPRVVAQSIAPETDIPRGTAVDIVLSNPALMGTGLVAGAHVGLAENSILEVADIFLGDPLVRREFERAARYEDLPPAVREVVETSAREREIILVEGTPGQDSNALFTAIQAAGIYS